MSATLCQQRPAEQVVPLNTKDRHHQFPLPLRIGGLPGALVSEPLAFAVSFTAAPMRHHAPAAAGETRPIRKSGCRMPRPATAKRSLALPADSQPVFKTANARRAGGGTAHPPAWCLGPGQGLLNSAVAAKVGLFDQSRSGRSAKAWISIPTASDPAPIPGQPCLERWESPSADDMASCQDRSGA